MEDELYNLLRYGVSITKQKKKIEKVPLNVFPRWIINDLNHPNWYSIKTIMTIRLISDKKDKNFIYCLIITRCYSKQSMRTHRIRVMEKCECVHVCDTCVLIYPRRCYVRTSAVYFFFLLFLRNDTTRRSNPRKRCVEEKDNKIWLCFKDFLSFASL